MASTDWLYAARINEIRHCVITRELADEAVGVGDGVMTFSSGVPWVSCASGLGLGEYGAEPPVGKASHADSERYAADVATVCEFYRSRKVTPRVEVGSLAPEGLLGALSGAGFTTVHYENTLVADLAVSRERVSPPPGLEIVRTDPTDEAMLRTHAVLGTRWFVPEGEPVSEELLGMTARAVRHPRSIAFMGRMDGEYIAACGMESWEIEGDLVAALWGAAVEPRVRRRGVQLALLEHRLAVARELGCRIALIESKPGVATERNAARVGFGLAYVRAVMERTASSGGAGGSPQ